MLGCDAEALYYGIGQPTDPVKARLCAFIQQGQETEAQLVGFSGSHMLMVIYANGIGAARNIPYAIHLACTSSSAQAERDGRVFHLLGYVLGHHEHGHTDQFGFCDEASSGLTGGYCAAHDYRLKQQGEANAIAHFAASLPAAAQPAFIQLLQAQAVWGQARSSHEVDLTGTLRAAFEIDERDLQERDFIAMLDRLRTGQPPHLGPADLADAQARMQTVLSRIQREAGYLRDGTVTREGVQEDQYSWEAYRDAWGAFVVAAYPSWSAAGAEAWLTMKRVNMLANLQGP